MQLAKQLIKIGEQTLLERAIEQALTSELGPVTVVYGAHQKQVAPLLGKWPVQPFFNPDWAEGLGASIRNGVDNMLQQETPANLLIMLADQPLIDASLLRKLATLHQESDKLVTACQYGNTIGVPAIFSPPTFADLKNMQGDRGAKSLMLKYQASDELALLDAPNAAIDLDTQEDLSDFLKRRIL